VFKSIEQYTCRAQNEHGWDELIQKLEVVGKLSYSNTLSLFVKKKGYGSISIIP